LFASFSVVFSFFTPSFPPSLLLQDSTYVTRVFPFTSHLPTITENINSMTAEGGGDGPEAMADALHDLLHLEWRSSSSSPSTNTSKVAVLIADAPPHGLGERGDGFPNGCPLEHDPLALTRQLAARGITLYTVGCEPAISTFENCKDLLIFMAETTGGQALVLESASLLAAVILGGAQEEVGLTRLEKEVGEVMREGGRQGGGEEEENEEVFVARVEIALRRKGTRTRQLKTNMRRMASAQAEVIASCSSLAEARTKLEGEGGREGGEEEEEEREGVSMLAVTAGMSSLSCCSFASAAAAPVDTSVRVDGSLPVPPLRVGWEEGKEGGRDGGRGRARLMAHDLLSRRGGGGVVTTPAAAAAMGAARAAAAAGEPPGIATLERGASWGREKWLSATHPTTAPTETNGFPAAVSTSSTSSASSSFSPFPPVPPSSPTHATPLMACAAVATEGGGQEGGRAEVAEEEISIDQVRRLVRKTQSLRGEGLRAGTSAVCPPSSSSPSSSSSNCSSLVSPPQTHYSRHAPTL
jgi:hypothetical protein